MSSEDNKIEERKKEDSHLFDIRKIEEVLNSKLESTTSSLTEKVEELITQMTRIETQFNHITSNLQEYKIKMDKVDDLVIFKTKITDQLTSHEIRINDIAKDLSNTKYKYDRIVLDNLKVPGFIGENCDFPNLKSYIISNRKDIAELKKFSDKTNLDLSSYKNKLESLIKQFTSQLTQFSDQQIEYSNQMKKLTMEYVDNCITNVEERIQELRIDNIKGSKTLIEKSDELKNELENVLNFKEEIKKDFSDEVNRLSTIFNNNLNEYNEFKTEYKRIKNKFAELVEFIKDVRFRKNLIDFKGIKKKEINDLTDKLSYKKKVNEEQDNAPKNLDLDYNYWTGKNDNDDENKSIKSHKYYKSERYSANIINLKNIDNDKEEYSSLSESDDEEEKESPFSSPKKNNKDNLNKNLLKNKDEITYKTDENIINEHENKIKDKIIIHPKHKSLITDHPILKPETIKSYSKSPINKGKYSPNKNVSFSQTMSNFKNKMNLNTNNNSRNNLTERNINTENNKTENNILTKNTYSTPSKNKNDNKFNSEQLFKKKIKLGRRSVPDVKLDVFDEEIPEGKKPAKILNLQFNFIRDISLGTSVKKDFNENNIKNYSRSSIDCSFIPDIKAKTTNKFFALKK